MSTEVGSSVCVEAQAGRNLLKAAKSNGKLLNELKSARARGDRVVEVWQVMDGVPTDGLEQKFYDLFMALDETVNEPIVAVDDLAKLQVIPSLADKIAIEVTALAEHGEELERDRLARFVDQSIHEPVVEEVPGELTEPGDEHLADGIATELEEESAEEQPLSESAERLRSQVMDEVDIEDDAAAMADIIDDGLDDVEKQTEEVPEYPDWMGGFIKGIDESKPVFVFPEATMYLMARDHYEGGSDVSEVLTSRHMGHRTRVFYEDEPEVSEAKRGDEESEGDSSTTETIQVVAFEGTLAEMLLLYRSPYLAFAEPASMSSASLIDLGEELRLIANPPGGVRLRYVSAHDFGVAQDRLSRMAAITPSDLSAQVGEADLGQLFVDQLVAAADAIGAAGGYRMDKFGRDGFMVLAGLDIERYADLTWETFVQHRLGEVSDVLDRIRVFSLLVSGAESLLSETVVLLDQALSKFDEYELSIKTRKAFLNGSASIIPDGEAVLLREQIESTKIEMEAFV